MPLARIIFIGGEAVNPCQKRGTAAAQRKKDLLLLLHLMESFRTYSATF